MAIVENADLKLTLTIYSDEETDIVIMLHEVAKKIKLGKLASQYGGCLGSYQYEIVEQSRATELRNEADRAGADGLGTFVSCPKCGKRRNLYANTVAYCQHCGDRTFVYAA